MQTIPYLDTDAVLSCLTFDKCYLVFAGDRWLVFNAVDEAAGATTTSVVEDLHRSRLITWETQPAPHTGVRWVATEDAERVVA